MPAVKASENAALQIRKILDGKGTAATRRTLVELGAVSDVLGALGGQHGPPAPGQANKAVGDLTDVLVAIAEDDCTPLREALAHDQPALNLVVWALGHSKSRHAHDVLKGLADHEDPAVGHVATHHVERHAATKKRPARKRRTAAKKKPAAKKPVKKKAAAKKKPAAKKPAAKKPAAKKPAAKKPAPKKPAAKKRPSTKK